MAQIKAVTVHLATGDRRLATFACGRDTLRSLAAAAAIGLAMLALACGPKVTKINEPTKVAQARVATFDELITLVNESYASSVRTLQVASLRVKAEGIERDKGLLKQYPRGSGYVILRRPASVHFNIN